MNEYRGMIEFDRDEYGRLVWRMEFEVPIPDSVTKRSETIFYGTGAIVQTREPHLLALDYRGAISAMARKFAEWEKMSQRMWREDVENEPLPRS